MVFNLVMYDTINNKLIKVSTVKEISMNLVNSIYQDSLT